MDDTFLIQLLCGWFVIGMIGAAIGQMKGRVGAGLFFGLLLGPLGWLLIAAGARGDAGKTKPCPFCAEQIQTAAVVCKHCGMCVEELYCPTCQHPFIRDESRVGETFA